MGFGVEEEKPYKASDLGLSVGESEGFVDYDELRVGVAVATKHEPLFAAKMRPITPPAGIDKGMFRQILATAWNTYLRDGKINFRELSQATGLSLQSVASVMNTPEVEKALLYRGIDLSGKETLTAEQINAISILTDISNRDSFATKLRKMGLPNATYRAWLKNPAFASRLSNISEEIINNNSAALIELGKAAAEGDFKAIKLQLEISGRHNPQQQQVIDMMTLIQNISGLLVGYLSDQPDLLMKIGDEIGTLEQKISNTGRQTLGLPIMPVIEAADPISDKKIPAKRVQQLDF